MATKKAVGRSYSVSFRINLEVGVTITAPTMEEALTQAKAMKVDDLLDFDGLEQNDSAIELVSIWDYIPINLRP